MKIDTTYRTQEEEIMDDFSLEGEELRLALDNIAGINRLLGGNRLTLDGVKQLLAKADKSMPISIVDVGCGNGDMLRMLARYGIEQRLKLNLIGVDANQFTIHYAHKLSAEYPNIVYRCLNIFTDEFAAMEYDIVLCTLTLHHFKEEQILKIISIFNKNAKTGVVINDLERSSLAYRLFGVVGRVFSLNRMAREDGLTSILRGFKKNELRQFADKLNIKNSSIRWKWAFRYQWIISKI
jgi:2-polyprenyl-3-methyl-5-hydroxy-6-metoxy-1,4-benzoquinol methylase